MYVCGGGRLGPQIGESPKEPIVFDSYVRFIDVCEKYEGLGDAFSMWGVVPKLIACVLNGCVCVCWFACFRLHVRSTHARVLAG